ncbi:MAG: replication-associated recombination protein A, partial [Phycisphaeraceae bacterium]|nr:replication-associated recombination protein A [Phycisphaeraceae bacterium]
SSPLSELLRPKKLDDIVGQEKTVGPNSRLGKLIRAGHIPSLILWGPPGTGKTTFALALASQTGAQFINLNAVDSGAKALREASEAGRERRLLHGQRTILFVDEIHRFNRAQQDVLLPAIEKGDVILVGATTENPSYELNRALLSRCRVVVFERLGPADLERLFARATAHLGVGEGEFVTPAAKDWLIEAADGDGRRLLNSLEVLFASRDGRDTPFEVEELRDLLQGTPIAYDKSSEMHYDVISAFIKSVRGSDADAAVYYLARMLEGGEDPRFIARRMAILASEDIGNADPRAIMVAAACWELVERIGMPEARITLGQCATYLALAPKSNASYLAINAAAEDVKEGRTIPVPLYLRDPNSSPVGEGVRTKNASHEKYKYSHDAKDTLTGQDYLGVEKRYYEPTENGAEKILKERLEEVRKRRAERRG